MTGGTRAARTGGEIVGALRPLGRAELRRDPVAVARRLLNAVIACDGRLARIVEVEAYAGTGDPASHAFRGKTARNATMFAAAGHLYVYLAYGLHSCANVVCEDEGAPGAVLLRAATPLSGLDEGTSGPPARVASGPGRLCRALGITRTHDGLDLLDARAAVRLYRDELPPPTAPLAAPRVGLSTRCGDALQWPWRFVVPGAAALSRPVPVAAGAARRLTAVHRSR